MQVFVIQQMFAVYLGLADDITFNLLGLADADDMTAFALHLTWFNVLYNTKTKWRLVCTSLLCTENVYIMQYTALLLSADSRL